MKIKVDNLAATVEKTLSDYADDVRSRMPGRKP